MPRPAKLKPRTKSVEAVPEPAEVSAPIPNGKPLVRMTVGAKELVPTGQYANVTIGPVEFTAWVDPDDPNPFTKDQLANLAAAANQMAEVVESDVVAVQRDIVQQSLQGE